MDALKIDSFMELQKNFHSIYTCINSVFFQTKFITYFSLFAIKIYIFIYGFEFKRLYNEKNIMNYVF